MKGLLRTILLVALAAMASSHAIAQQWRGREGHPPPRGAPMYRHGPPPAPQGMSPEQRERLRRDIQDANRGFERRR